MARESKPLLMDGWPRGVNNRARETEPVVVTGGDDRTYERTVTSEFLREAVNVDLTRFGHPLRREGKTLVHSAYTHSLWSDRGLSFGLCVAAGKLCKVSEAGDVHELIDVHSTLPMSYCTVNGEVYWSNGESKGKIDRYGTMPWGLPAPQVPELIAVQGSMPSGTYRVATVYVDETDEEHGASSEAQITITGEQSIGVTIPGQWPEGAAAVRVFCTQPNGEILYSVGVKTSPGQLVVQQSQLGRGRELETQNLKEPKPGHILRYYNGRIYIARNDTVGFTEALRFSLTRPSQGIYMFSSTVVLVEPVVDGVYVGSKEGVVFLEGSDPYDVVQRTVSPTAPVQRAVARVPGKYFETNEPDVPVWWGEDGCMMVGLPGGQVQQLSNDRLAVPRFSSGAMMYREREGMAQVVSSLHKGGEDSNLAAKDTVVAEIRRNVKKLN